ncbi:MAG: methyl-accepting chemotaxis protein [Gammaproteobacteria bacterium]
MLQKLRQQIESKLEYMPIKKKLQSGFGTLLGFMLVLVLLTVISLLLIKGNIDEVVDEYQPAQTGSLELWSELYRLSTAMGFYLLSNEAIHQEDYETGIERVDATLARLNQQRTILEDDVSRQLLTDIGTDIERFKSFQSRIATLAGNDSANMPGITYASEHLSPLGQEVLQSLEQMLLAELDMPFTKDRRDLLLNITGIRYRWMNIQNEVRAYLSFRLQNSLGNIAQANEVMGDMIAKLSARPATSALTFEQSDALETIKTVRMQFMQNLDTLIEIHGSENWRNDATLIRGEIGPIMQAVNEKLRRLEARQGELIAAANSALITQVVVTILIGLGLFATAFVVASKLSVQLINTIVTPLQEAVEATGRIASGDLTVSIEEKSSDEIGQLISSLNMMTANLSSLVHKVQQSGIQVTSSSTEIAATAKQQEATVSEQAATANQISTTATEISATTQELVETMDEVTHIAETTAMSAGNSQSALASMEQTMHHMMDATGSISAKLSVLSEKAANINSVVTTITKVADQTNLLSLNAAIEAEKAGEYGIGFSVVATEIRRLADQTAVATWDIEQMVKEMQSAVSTGVMGMDKFSDEVRKGVDEVRHVGGQLAEIIEQVQNLLPGFAAVHEGMQNQALSAQQITESISQLSDGTQQTADSLRQSGGAITQLHTAARALQDGVSRFKVKAGIVS